VTLFHAAVSAETGVGIGVGKGAAPDMVNCAGVGVTSEVPKRDASRNASLPALGVALFSAGVVAGTAIDANGNGDAGGDGIGVGLGVGVGVGGAARQGTLALHTRHIRVMQNRLMEWDWAWVSATE
jgi:hypothetical protein